MKMEFSKMKKFGQRQQEATTSVRPNGNSCDVCRHKGLKPAKFHCAKCTVYYCSDCIPKHNNNPLFHGHHVSNLVAEKNKWKPCRDHPSHNVVYLCQTCYPKRTLCAICVLDHARGHTYEDLEEKGKEVRESLKEGLRKVNEKSNQLREYIQMINRKADHQNSVLKTVHEDIKRHTQRLIEAIQQSERQMLKNAREEVLNRKAIYNQGAFELELLNLERVANELEITIKSSDENCISSHQRLEERIKHMMVAQIPDKQTFESEADMEFTPDIIDADLRIGTLTYNAVWDDVADQKTNILKRKHINNHGSSVDSGLDSQSLSAMRSERSSPSPSSVVHKLEKKKKKVSATTTGRPGTSTPQSTSLGEIEIPPPYHEPKREPVFNGTDPHIFWDIRLSERKQDDICNIIELCAVSSSGVMMSSISDELPIEKALQEFITFIGNNREVLCGHNIKEYKCQALLQAMKSCNLDFSFENATAGFIDTLPMLKIKFSDFEPITVEALYQHSFGKTYQVESTFSTVQALQRLVGHVCPDRTERLLHSFKTSYIPNLCEFHTYRRRNFVSWKPLVDNKVISRHIGDKAAGSGLELKHVQFIYAKQGLEGLTSLLSKPGPEGNPRVTNREKIIKELAEYLQNT